MNVLAKLDELGLTLPPVAAPVAAYLPAVRSGQLVYTAGQLPTVDGKVLREGKVGDVEKGGDVTPEDAKVLAQRCALNGLAAVHDLVGLGNIERVVKVVGFVASAPGFTGQPAVINGASEFLVEVFGEAGKHARSAVGVAELPRNTPVEVEFIFSLAATAELATTAELAITE